MGAAEEIRRALDDIRAIDHHAHVLAGPGAPYELPDLLTEATDPAQIALVRDHPAYARGVRELTALLGVDQDPAAINAARERHGFEGYARILFEACHLDEMLVDDGLRFPGALSLDEHTALVGCPVRRVVRIESVAEAAADGWPSFAEVRERFGAELDAALAAGAAGLKTIAAYRCGLDLPSPDRGRAESAYDGWRASESRRLTDPGLVTFFLEEALDAIRERPVPLQVHTGFGDTDLVLHRADPSLLRPLFQDPRNAGIPMVLLHCYPFVRQASYLASVYPNVHLDLSLALTFVAHRASDLVLEALDLAPVDKLLFASDASRLPELYFLGAVWWRDAIAGAFSRLIDEGVIDTTTALRWAELIFAGNARRIYDRGDDR